LLRCRVFWLSPPLRLPRLFDSFSFSFHCRCFFAFTDFFHFRYDIFFFRLTAAPPTSLSAAAMTAMPKRLPAYYADADAPLLFFSAMLADAMLMSKLCRYVALLRRSFRVAIWRTRAFFVDYC
jgi:hypothetical protein